MPAFPLNLLGLCRWLAGRRCKPLEELGPEDLAAVNRDVARKGLASGPFASIATGSIMQG